MPEVGRESDVGEQLLELVSRLRLERLGESVAVPPWGERPHVVQRHALADLGLALFGLSVLRPKKRDAASREDDVVPPVLRQGDVTRASSWRAATTASEFHAQFAHHAPRFVVTTKSVGSAANGNAIRISPRRRGPVVEHDHVRVVETPQLCVGCVLHADRRNELAARRWPSGVDDPSRDGRGEAEVVHE